MTREEAIKILKSMSDISTQGDAIDMAIEALLSSDALLKQEIDFHKEVSRIEAEKVVDLEHKLADMVSVVRCKDCKYFELDHFDRIDDMPIITAHEICTKWSGGSKTSKDGFCFMGEKRE